jgi:hypothetical protein
MKISASKWAEIRALAYGFARETAITLRAQEEFLKNKKRKRSHYNPTHVVGRRLCAEGAGNLAQMKRKR